MAKLSHFISHSSRWRSLQLALSFWQAFEKLMLHSWLGTSTEKVVRELDVYKLLLLSVLASAEVATNSPNWEVENRKCECVWFFQPIDQ